MLKGMCLSCQKLPRLPATGCGGFDRLWICGAHMPQQISSKIKSMFGLYFRGGRGKTVKAEVGTMKMVHVVFPLTPWACDDRQNGKCLQFSTCCDSNLYTLDFSKNLSWATSEKGAQTNVRATPTSWFFSWWNEVPKKSDWDVGGHLTGGFLVSRKSARFLMTTPSGCFEAAFSSVVVFVYLGLRSSVHGKN